MNFVEFWSQNNIVVNLVMIFLLIMSLLSWYVIFYKAILLKKDQKNFHKINQLVAQSIHTNDWFLAISTILKSHKFGGSAEIILRKVSDLEPTLAGYKSHEAKKEILTMHLIQCLDEIRFWLDKGLTILASIGSSAPFIGLLGTVVGIYDALQNIALQGNAGLSAVSAPISEALIATAIGLFVAIPAVLAYNYFVRINRLLVQNLRHLSEQLTVYISNQPAKNAPNL